MTTELVTTRLAGLSPTPQEWLLPPIVAGSGPAAPERFLEFFTVTIRNPNTRRA